MRSSTRSNAVLALDDAPVRVVFGIEEFFQKPNAANPLPKPAHLEHPAKMSTLTAAQENGDNPAHERRKSAFTGRLHYRGHHWRLASRWLAPFRLSLKDQQERPGQRPESLEWTTASRA
jgi:hypothetical protein